jgi:hypothetical protein
VQEPFELYYITYVNETITGGLRSDQTTTPASSLASQYALPPVLLSTISTEEPSDLTTGDTNITGWNISVCSNVLVQLAHEGNAELPDLIV